MSRLINLSGRLVGRWTVVHLVHDHGKSGTRWLCRCSCGTIRAVSASHLTKGRSKSCGCLHKERAAKRMTTHGEAGNDGMTLRKPSPEYSTWLGMIKRCEDPNSISFEYYGGRGIKVCRRWRKSFPAFLADMGRKPSPQHSIDRYPNNNGDYTPNNCRWATKKEQTANRRRT